VGAGAEVLAATVQVDQRSDTYALGVVLFELLTGELPFPAPARGLRTCEALRALATARRSEVPSPRQINPDVPQPLDQVVRRCLDPDPGRRYQTAAELAQALQGCGELRRVERELPAPGPLTRAAVARPFLLLAVLTLFPHFLGSAVNICYNALCIVRSLTPAQQDVFAGLVLGYNLLMYPACLAILVGLVVPGWKTNRALGRGQVVGGAQMAAVRRGVLGWPLWAVAVSCLGWLPGGLLFPLAISFFAGPVGIDVFGHFAVSFTVSGLIALTYSFFAVQFIVLRVLYGRLWVDGQDFGAAARAELGALGPRLRWFSAPGRHDPPGRRRAANGRRPGSLRLSHVSSAGHRPDRVGHGGLRPGDRGPQHPLPNSGGAHARRWTRPRSGLTAPGSYSKAWQSSTYFKTWLRQV
jgi:eukaryotic-like serine/threonine-protein kinase